MEWHLLEKLRGDLLCSIWSYLDELLCRFVGDASVGCYTGKIFFAARAYADDIVLLAPTA